MCSVGKELEATTILSPAEPTAAMAASSSLPWHGWSVVLKLEGRLQRRGGLHDKGTACSIFTAFQKGTKSTQGGGRVVCMRGSQTDCRNRGMERPYQTVTFLTQFPLLAALKDVYKFNILCVCAKSLQCLTEQCLTICDSMDCSPPGSSVHGNL